MRFIEPKKYILRLRDKFSILREFGAPMWKSSGGW